MPTQESQLEELFIERLRGLKYEYREDIRDRAALEQNFRQKFEVLNRVALTTSEFPRLLEEIITPDVFTAARTLRERNSFILMRMIFDGEHLGDLMAPLGLGWKARIQKELALMDELTPLLRKRALGRDISGLNAYEQ